MCPTRVHEEVEGTTRCAIWWHLALMFSLIGGGLSVLGLGWLYNANLGRENASEIRSVNTRASRQDKDLDEMKADIKELLRRSSRSGVGEKG